MSDEEQQRPLAWWRRRNWWKIAFFVMLVAFEIAREFAVLNADRDADPNIAVIADVSHYGPSTRAVGRWTRTDGGGRMVPGATVITCDENEGTCTETTASLFNGYLNEPTTDVYPATFSPEGVSYQNDIPQCVRYSVRIDYALEKVLALRQRKAGKLKEICDKLEPRIEMTLGDGYQSGDTPFGDHFVPIVRLISALVKM